MQGNRSLMVVASNFDDPGDGGPRWGVRLRRTQIRNSVARNMIAMPAAIIA